MLFVIGDENYGRFVPDKTGFLCFIDAYGEFVWAREPVVVTLRL